MSPDRHSVLKDTKQQLIGGRYPVLPPQKTLWGWIRAALAFQPAHPTPSPVPPTPADPQNADTSIDAAGQPPAGTSDTSKTDAAADGRADNPPARPVIHPRIASLSPAQRIALRAQPGLTAVLLSAFLVRTITLTLDRASDLALALGRELDRALAIDLGRASDLAHTSALALDLAFDRALALDLARDLAHASNLASASARNRVTEVFKVGSVVRGPGLWQ